MRLVPGGDAPELPQASAAEDQPLARLFAEHPRRGYAASGQRSVLAVARDQTDPEALRDLLASAADTEMLYLAIDSKGS